ncbi:MAG: hypothetical protein LCH82_01215 [Actinobacteria bacterium]|nr:hypothetical protein [Actinomycetota bacterium]
MLSHLSLTHRGVLFVCTANISRSPYAELVARARYGGRGIRFASAGVPGTVGRSLDPEMGPRTGTP